MARPRLDDDQKRKLVSLRLSPDTLAVIKTLAAADGVSLPFFLEKMVTDGLMSRIFNGG